MKSLALLFTAITLTFSCIAASAQARYINSARVTNTPEVRAAPDSLTARTVEQLDEFLDSIANSPSYDLYAMPRLPRYFFMPAIYDRFRFADTTAVLSPTISGKPELRWAEEQAAVRRAMDDINRTFFFNHPQLVKYNVRLLPEAPKQFHAVVNPEDHTIEIVETIPAELTTTVASIEVKKRHWIRTFSAGLQFSQAYISPNWYQGGNNNLNVLGNIYYNVKLNPTFHPNLLFETTAQYKLGMNNAPNDTVHDYSVSDDVFQVNTTFGVKAARRWYYSFNAQFKTQLLNSYNSNSSDLRSGFLSPGELTAGIGMTYNYANAKKTFTFDASIAPVSYKLMTCIEHRLDPTAYGIKEGRKVSHNFGSSADLKLFWQITYNITYATHLFAFTDYDTAQADWEHKLTFDINRFLSTQISANLRYDTSTPRIEDHPDWKKLQVKEVLSIGFAYKFASL